MPLVPLINSLRAIDQVIDFLVSRNRKRRRLCSIHGNYRGVKEKVIRMATREAITRLTRQIFGTLPNKNISTGHQLLKKRHTAILDARYYIDSIESAARMVRLLQFKELLSA